MFGIGNIGQIGLLGGDAGPSVPSPLGAFTLVSGVSHLMFGPTPNGYTDDNGSVCGAVSDATGIQYLVQIDKVTGAMTATQVCSAYTATIDNHKTPSPSKTPQGALVVASCGHNEAAEVRVKYSADGTVANLGAEKTVTLPALATYWQWYPEASDMFGLYRGSQIGWYWAKRASGDGNDIGTVYSNPFFTDPAQCYVKVARIGTNLYLCHATTNPNLDNASVYSFTVNVATGDVKNKAGTTVANFITGSPKATAVQADVDLFYAPGAGSSAGAGDFAPDGTWGLFGVQNNDNQFQDIYEKVWDGVGNIADPASWSINFVRSIGYGVGSTTSTPFAYLPRAAIAEEAELSGPRIYFQERFGGMNFVGRMDKISGAWRDTLFIKKVAQGLDLNSGFFYPIPDGTPEVPAWMIDTIHPQYDGINGSTSQVLRIDSVGTGTPTMTSAATFNATEYKNFSAVLQGDRPCGFNITGGADAAFFEIHGNELQMRLAKTVAAPLDADADNTYVVEVTPYNANGAGTPQTISVPVAALTLTGGANLYLQTANLTNAAWTPTGVTAAHSSTDFVDADGGNTLEKLTGAATSAPHRVAQSKTLAASTKHFLSLEGRYSATAHFLSQAMQFGGAAVATATFDMFRGRFVGPGQGSNALDAFAIVQLANSNYLIAIIATTPASTSSSEQRIIQRQYSGPLFVELGTTSIKSYVRKPMLGASDFKTYVARTT